MAFPILGTPKPAFFDSNGDPLVSGTLTILDPADDSAKTYYPTADDANASNNGSTAAITLDSRGEVPNQLWGRDFEDYKVVLKDSAGTTIWTVDDIRLPFAARDSVATIGAADATPSTANAKIFVTNTASTVTDFDDAEIGDIIIVVQTDSSNAITLTQDTGQMQLQGQNDYAIGQYDAVVLLKTTSGIWTEIARSENRNLFWSPGADTTLALKNNNATIFITSAEDYTLPAASNGLKFTFIAKEDITVTDATIITPGGANLIYGSVINAGTGAAADAEDTITFNAGSALQGDRVDLVCDGTDWYMVGIASAAGGITVSAT